MSGDISGPPPEPSSGPTEIFPNVPTEPVDPYLPPTEVIPTVPPVPPSHDPPVSLGPGGRSPDPDRNRTVMLIAGSLAALIVLAALIFVFTRDGDDGIESVDSTIAAASTSVPGTTALTSVPPSSSVPSSSVASTTTSTTVVPATTTTAAPPPATTTTTTAAPPPATTTTSTTTSTTTTTTTSTVPPLACMTDWLDVTLGDSEGAAGSTFTEIYVANTSGGATCVLSAPATIRFEDAGNPVGAEIVGSSTSPIVLRPGEVASAVWRMSRADLFDCTPSGPTEMFVVFGDAKVSAGEQLPVCATPPEAQGSLEGFTPGFVDSIPG